MSGLPVVENLHTLADYVHLSKGLLYRLSKYNGKYYKSFKLRKKSGGYRIIHCPSKEMKAVQSWILRNILDQVHVTESATGFRIVQNLLYNVVPHKDNRYFLCLDIYDFFTSIKYSRFFNIFNTLLINPTLNLLFLKNLYP